MGIGGDYTGGGGSGAGRSNGRDDNCEGGGGDDRWLWFAAAATRPWHAYMNLLDQYPLVIKAATAGLVGGLGDLISQRVTSAHFDAQRFHAVCIDGFFVSGPALHLGYGFLERRLPCSHSGRSAVRNALLQVVVDECVFHPLFIGTFFFTTGAVERQHLWKEVVPNLRRQYLPTLRGAWVTSAIFTPIQFISFRYLPVSTRVLVVNCCDILWYAAVSLGRHRERSCPVG